MDKNPFFKINSKFSLKFCLIIIASLFYLSCSTNTPSIVSVDAKVIYDFESDGSKPVQKLNVFLRMDSDVRRVDSMTICHKQTGYRWVITNPMISHSDNTYYAGYTNLTGSSQNDNSLPQGEYSVFCIDASGRECYAEFSISLDFDLEKIKSADVVNGYDPDTQFFHVGLYSQEANLLYYGAPKKDWQTPQKTFGLDSKKIFSQYKEASFYRVFNYRNNNVFILPKVQKTVEHTQDQEIQQTGKI